MGKKKLLFMSTSALALVLAVGAVAWACTNNMQGSIWFTSTDTNGACTSNTISSAASLATICSQASGLARDSSGGSTDKPRNWYELRYTPLNTDEACHNSPFVLPNTSNPSVTDGFFTALASPAGGWADQKVILTMAPGSYAFCAATPNAYVVLGNETGWWSNHTNFTVT